MGLLTGLRHFPHPCGSPDLGRCFGFLGGLRPPSPRGAPPTGDWWCLLLLKEGPGGVPCPGAMLLIVGRTASAIAAGRASYRGLVVSAALVGGPPRRDVFGFWADYVRHRRGARLLQGIGGVSCFCGRADLGAMLLIVARTMSAIAAGRASYRGLVVSAAFVGGPTSARCF